MMSEDRFGWQVRQLLNKSAQEVTPSVSSRLEKARQMAMSRKKQDSKQWAFVTSPSVAMAGFGAQTSGNRFDFGALFSSVGGLIPAVALVLGIAFVADYQSNNRAVELAEIDTAVLADDLPLSAYLDQGFSLYVDKKPTAFDGSSGTRDSNPEKI